MDVLSLVKNQVLNFKIESLVRSTELAENNLLANQHKTLLSLIVRARSTKFGQAHNFHKICNLRDFQEKVP